MKKTTILLLFMLAMTLVQAQKAIDRVYKVENVKSNKELSANKLQVKTKTAGTIFWSEDFAKEDWISTVDEQDKGGYLSNGSELPGKWSAYDITTDGSKKSVWHWSDVGWRGITNGTDYDWDVPNDDLNPDLYPEGNTVANGAMMLELSYANTTVLGESPAEDILLQSYVMYGPIDLSDANGVLINLALI